MPRGWVLCLGGKSRLEDSIRREDARVAPSQQRHGRPELLRDIYGAARTNLTSLQLVHGTRVLATRGQARVAARTESLARVTLVSERRGSRTFDIWLTAWSDALSSCVGASRQRRAGATRRRGVRAPRADWLRQQECGEVRGVVVTCTFASVSPSPPRPTQMVLAPCACGGGGVRNRLGQSKRSRGGMALQQKHGGGPVPDSP